MLITQIPSQYVSLVWPEIKEFVSKATEHSRDRTDQEFVRKDCESGSVLLFIAHDESHETYGFMTCSIIDYPKMKVLSLQFLGGREFSKWSNEMFGTLEIFARENNCSKIEGGGRKGWIRFLKRFGYTPASYISEKDLR